MPNRYWLVKQEPSQYPWSQLVKDKKTYWDGVRNYQARNNLKEMNKGDLVLYYHSVIGTEVVGICEVVRESYPDPTTEDDRWVVVDLAAREELARPVSLAEIKKDPSLADMALVKQSRLSVTPVTKRQFHRIVKLSKNAIRSKS